MAFSMIRLGEPYTCNSPCEHRDCAEARRLVATLCHYCNAAIGEDKEFCFDREQRPVHFWCAAPAGFRSARYRVRAGENLEGQ